MIKVRAARGAAALVALSLVAGGCGGGKAALEPKGFEPTHGYLAVLVTSSRRTPHKYTSRISLGLPSPGDDAPVVTGSSDGRWTYSRSDARAAVESSGQKLPFDAGKVSWVTETVTDGSTFYMRAPFIDDVARGRKPDTVPAVVNVLKTMGNSWGKVDLASLGDPVPNDVGKWLPGTRDFGVRQALDMLVNATNIKVERPTVIDGQRYAHLSAQVGYADLLEAEGVDVSSALASPNTPPDFAKVINNAELRTEVWVDRQGHVRRLKVDTGSSFAQIAKAVGGADKVPDEFRIEGVFDFSDYGDQGIDVKLPAAAQTVDITAPLHKLVVADG